jgi:hypothetical protein
VTSRPLVAAACALLIATAGCAALGGSAAEVTVDNARETEYRMTAYLIEEPVDAGEVAFRATNETGARTTVERLRFETDGPYYDAALTADLNATARRLVVPPGETRSAAFDAWEPGTAVVYVFEAPDGRVVRSAFSDCPDDSLRHTFVFSDGPENGHRATCS